MKFANNIKTILIIEPENQFAQKLKNVLMEEGYSVVTCSNEKEAKKVLENTSIDAVVSEVYLIEEFSGVEFLEFIRRELMLTIPVVLFSDSARYRNNEKYNEFSLDAFFTKPFNKDDLINVFLKNTTFNPVELYKTIEPVEEEYIKVGIDSFISGKENPYDIFLKLSDKKFIKIAHVGEPIPLEQIRSYKTKNVKHLYFKREDFRKYLELNVKVVEAAKDNKQISNERKLSLVSQANEIILESFYSKEVDLMTLESARTVFNTCIGSLVFDNAGETLIDLLKSKGDSDYSHSISVAFLSILIAKELGWSCNKTFYNLYMAGLFKDIGLRNIPKELIEKNHSELTAAERKEFENHPIYSAEILSEFPSIPSVVIQTVLQHHENCAGQGYPYKLKKSQINPMARIISVAGIFCDFAVSGKFTLSPKESLERMIQIHSQTLDEKCVQALMSIFNLKKK